MKQLVCDNQCIAIGKVGCEVGILHGSTWTAMDEIDLCKRSAVACRQSKGMLEQLQAGCLKSQYSITASKARLLQEVKVWYLLDPDTIQQSSK
jgi:hypothetical protein